MDPRELKTFADILVHLKDLNREAQERVIAYVQAAIRAGSSSTEVPIEPDSSLTESRTAAVSESSTDAARIVDIRSLKEEKKPSSAVEMAVLIAYYLQELVKPEDKKTSIGVLDLDHYFKQAQYKIPSRLDNVLTLSRNSGYMDRKKQGQYALNPVGYNLVVHSLPRSGKRKYARKKFTPAKPRVENKKVIKKTGKSTKK